MCGLFGAVGGPPMEGGTTDRIRALLRHRGPDADGVLATNEFAFVHTRLKIIDLSPLGAQPMQLENGMALVFNGEIYNFRELRTELEGLGHTFRSKSDTEVILRGYAAWGDAVVDRIDGMFAFGLYDPSKRRLLVARDRVGKKPLFYHHSKGRLCFASEIKALLASGAPLEVDPEGLARLLAYGYVPPPGTMYRGILQLPPAHRLVFEPASDALRLACYYEPHLGEGPTDDRPAPIVLADLRSALEDAVRKRLVADVPVGAFLSGGIDSTIVVGLMSRLGAAPVRTFSIGFEGDARYDETHFARMAAKAFETHHTEFVVRASDFDLVDRLIWFHDGPFGDSSAIPTYVVSKLTREYVTVALTGDGGDELFAGYLRLPAGAAIEHIPTPLRRVLGKLSAFVPRGLPDRSLPARARRFLGATGLDLGDRVAQWTGYFTFSLKQILRPDVFAAAGDVLSFHRGFFPSHDARTPLYRLLAHNFGSYLPYDLLVKADRSSMAHGLELRSPLLDTALIAKTARLPDRMLVDKTTLKAALRRACADLLPPAIARRGKMGFGMPLGTWFRGRLEDLLREELLAKTARIREYLEPSVVASTFFDHREGRADNAHQLWLLLTLERWLRRKDALLAPL